MDSTARYEAGCLAALGVGAALLALLRPDKAIDFRVYYENAHHYFRAGQAMYGPSSGTGWAGGVYRYPPLFLDLFRPLALLPLRLAVVLWAIGKIAAGGALVVLARRRWGVSSLLRFWPGLLLIAPYFIQELRYGNAQFYIVALALAGLWVAESPGWGGVWLGLAAALKIWPLFFFPFLFLQRQWSRLAAATGAAVVWTLLPILWRGWTAQWRLLGQWLAQERSIAATSAGAGELWYPGQSLHDVMARYLTRVDYAHLVDGHYPQIAWLNLSPAAFDAVWWGAAALLLAGLAWCVWRGGDSEPDRHTHLALLFCGVVVLEPHVHRLILETLLFPAIWMACLWVRGALGPWSRSGYAVAVAVAALEPLVPGGARQRVMQAYGVDFWLVVVPLTVAVVAALPKPRQKRDLRQIKDARSQAVGAH